MARAASELESGSTGRARWRAVAEVALVFLVFFIHGAWRVPDVNEPHYLGKARHYWDPSWCAGDFFLGTADAHEVFYFAFGWTTLWLPLPAVSWLGRLLTWALLAWAWRRLSLALVEGPLYSVLSAALFVALVDRFHMAGEWVVGGVEGKSFAYVFVLLGLEALIRDRWGRALVALGAASAFHVIVGGWAFVAAAVVWLVGGRKPSWRSLLLPAAAGLLLALLGIVPGIALTWQADPQLVSQANRIYVYERLTHHLLPQSFPPWFIARHLLLVAALVPLVHNVPSGGAFGRLRVFVAAAVGIAAVGMAISLAAWWQPDAAAALLRYYWFRSSDVMVPLGVALLASAVLLQWQRAGHPWFALALSAAMLAAGLHLGELMWLRHSYRAPRADWPLARTIGHDDWLAVCRWAAEETPPEALFLVPRKSHTFRWHAGRGEVVTRKDLPQDAAGIVEWWNRLTHVYRSEDTQAPYDSLADAGAERLAELAEQYGADYVVTAAEPRLPLRRVGPLTPGVAVYELPRRGPQRDR